MNVWEIDVLSDLGTLHSPSEMGQWRLVASCCRVCSYAFTVYDLYPDRLYSDIILCICPKWWTRALCLHMVIFSLSVYTMNSICNTYTEIRKWAFSFLTHRERYFFHNCRSHLLIGFSINYEVYKKPMLASSEHNCISQRKEHKNGFFFFIFLKNEI